jgi:hypothetical protein
LDRLCVDERLGLLDRLEERFVDPERDGLERLTLELDLAERPPPRPPPRRCASAIVASSMLTN